MLLGPILKVHHFRVERFRDSILIDVPALSGSRFPFLCRCSHAYCGHSFHTNHGGGSMANANQVRAALEKEFTRMRKASERFEARLKSTADDVTTGTLALEKVLAKELSPNVSAGLKVIEKELAAYRKAGERELTRLAKSYDRELAKLRKAKERVEKEVTKKAKPARSKAKVAAKPASKTAAAPKRAKPAAKKAVKSRAKTVARKAPAKAAARKTPARKVTGKTASAAKKPKAKAEPYRRLKKRQGDPGAHLVSAGSK